MKRAIVLLLVYDGPPPLPRLVHCYVCITSNDDMLRLSFNNLINPFPALRTSRDVHDEVRHVCQKDLTETSGSNSDCLSMLRNIKLDQL